MTELPSSASVDPRLRDYLAAELDRAERDYPLLARAAPRSARRRWPAGATLALVAVVAVAVVIGPRLVPAPSVGPGATPTGTGPSISVAPFALTVDDRSSWGTLQIMIGDSVVGHVGCSESVAITPGDPGVPPLPWTVRLVTSSGHVVDQRTEAGAAGSRWLLVWDATVEEGDQPALGPMPECAMPSPSIEPSVGPPGTPLGSDALVPALSVDHPTVTVSPPARLKDGQVVKVSVTGFGVGGKVWLSECASADVATDLGCGVELAAQPFLVTDDSRAGSGELVVRGRASATSLAAGPSMPCADRCVIVATLGSGYPYVVAPIAFAHP